MSDLTDSLNLRSQHMILRVDHDLMLAASDHIKNIEAALQKQVTELALENMAKVDQAADGGWLPIESAPENQHVNVRRLNKISSLEDIVVLFLRHVKALGDPVWISVETGKEVSLSAWQLLAWATLPPAPKGPDA